VAQFFWLTVYCCVCNAQTDQDVENIDKFYFSRTRHTNHRHYTAVYNGQVALSLHNIHSFLLRRHAMYKESEMTSRQRRAILFNWDRTRHHGVLPSTVLRANVNSRSTASFNSSCTDSIDLVCCELVRQIHERSTTNQTDGARPLMTDVAARVHRFCTIVSVCASASVVKMGSIVHLFSF